MNKLKSLLIFLSFALVVGVYYFVVSPMLASGHRTFYFADDFSTIKKDFWYAASMEDNKELRIQDFIKTKLILRKYDNHGDVYFLTKPIPMTKKQVLSIKRKVRIQPGEEYFSGGLALFQTSSKYRVIDPANKYPFGSAISLVEYVSNSEGGNERPGNHNIRILAPDYKQTGNYLLLDPVFNKWFEEEIVYSAEDGKLKYIIDGEEENFMTAPLSDSFIRLWMHAYGNSKVQEIEVENIEIEVRNQ